MDIDYRPFRTADAKVLLDLMMAVSCESDSLVFSPAELSEIDLNGSEELLKAATRGMILTGAFSEGKMLAVCNIVPSSHEVRAKHKAHMHILVRAEFRKKGIAQHLINYAIDMAKEKGIRKISISVADNNEDASELLLSVGFVREGRDLRMLNVDGSYIDGERFAYLID